MVPPQRKDKPVAKHPDGTPIGNTAIHPNLKTGGQKTKFSDLTEVRFLFADCDNRSLTIEEQIEKFREVFPEPSYLQTSGDRGVHPFWKLSKGVRPGVGRCLFRLVLRKGGKELCDQQIVCPARGMRAPGSLHGGTGKQVVRFLDNKKEYTLREMGLFPWNGGEVSGTTPPACVAVEHLLRKGENEVDVREVAELHGWKGKRLEKLMDPEARGAIVAQSKEDAGEDERKNPKDVLEQIKAHAERITKEGGTNAEQTLKLKLAVRGCGVSDQLLTQFLADQRGLSGGGEMVVKTRIKKTAMAQYTGPFVSGAFNLLVAMPKTGKTWMAAEFARRALEGRGRFMAGKRVKPVDTVFFVSFDQGEGSDLMMFLELGITKETDGDELDLMPGFHLINEGRFSLEGMAKHTAAHPGCLVVVDSLTTVKPSDVDENKADIGVFLKGFQGLPGRPTVILIHHSSKTLVGDGNTRHNAIRGNSAIQGAADWIVSYESPTKKTRNGVQIVASGQRRIYAAGRSLESFEVFVGSRSYEVIAGTDFGEEEGSRTMEVVDVIGQGKNALRLKILEVLREGGKKLKSVSAIAKEVGRDRANKNVKDLVKELQEIGAVAQNKETKVFSLGWPKLTEEQEELLEEINSNPAAEIKGGEMEGDALRDLVELGVVWEKEGRYFGRKRKPEENQLPIDIEGFC